MLIKEKDKNQQQIDYLSDLLERDLPADKKQFIERELKFISSGDKGEKSSAYYLDFDFRASKNWALIHDLRIEHDGDVAQIDHLLIGRAMDVYVIESKNFTSGVSISDEGDFSYFYNNSPCVIASPVEQNKSHIKLLDQFLTANDLCPKRLGVALKPDYKNTVLIANDAMLIKPKKGLFDCSAVMTWEKFSGRFEKDTEDDDLNSIASLARVISTERLRSFAEKLACLHRPLTIDYTEKFDIDNVTETDVLNVPACPGCARPMVKRVVKKGKAVGKEFWGCSDYPKCKTTVDINAGETPEQKQQEPLAAVVPVCPECNKPMIKRVSKKGSTQGNEFWGCVDFPQCKATLQLDLSGADEPVVIAPVIPQLPLCPKCSAAMVKRVSNKGDNAGREFWGCVKFPDCRGVISID